MNSPWRRTSVFSLPTCHRIAAALAWLLAAGLSCAHPRAFDVRGGALKPALDAYIAQAGVQLIYKVDDVRDLSTPGVQGTIAPEKALERLLQGTHLRVRRGQDGAMVLIAQPPVRGTALPATMESRP
ncbi:STN domain-containing protein [Variovorax boronicumulans]|uniref:STN domain-containing protein n=1 Tax=Variovorax boronicumulans TaxID=436515 RepID=UPI001C56C366